MFAFSVCLVSLLAVQFSGNRASAQDKQGRYITEAAERLNKAIDKSNKDGFILANNRFSVGGGWLKQSKKDWIPLYTVQLTKGKTYRFLAAGDADAKDVDLDIINEDKKSVAKDADTDPLALVDFTPKTSGLYTVRVRLYASRNSDPCLCLAVMMVEK
jgi:hypothetical protein